MASFPWDERLAQGPTVGSAALRGYSPLVRQLWQRVVAPLPSQIRWTRLCPVKLYRAPILSVCGRGRSRWMHLLIKMEGFSNED